MAAWQGRKVTYGPKHRATMLSTARQGAREGETDHLVFFLVLPRHARLGSQLLAHNRPA